MIDLEQLLSKHGEYYDSDCGIYRGCACGWNNDTEDHNQGYEAHLVGVLEPVIQAAKAEALRGAARGVLKLSDPYSVEGMAEWINALADWYENDSP